MISFGAEKPRTVSGSPGKETMRAPLTKVQLDLLSSSSCSTGSSSLRKPMTLANSSRDWRRLGETSSTRPGHFAGTDGAKLVHLRLNALALRRSPRVPVSHRIISRLPPAPIERLVFKVPIVVNYPVPGCPVLKVLRKLGAQSRRAAHDPIPTFRLGIARIREARSRR